jgi:hypothetical protein
MTRRARRNFVRWLALAAAFCGHSGIVWAEPAVRVALEYAADPALDCPSAVELSSSIVAQLGYDPFTSQASEPRLRVAITKLVDGAEAQIEWIDQQQRSEGERRLASGGSGCAELARSLPFALAVQIQLHAAAGPPATAAPHERPPSPTPRPKNLALAPEPAPAKRLVLVGAGVMARHGLGPEVAAGLRVFGVYSRARWSLELSAHATLPAELQQADGTGFSSRELGANLAPCARFAPLGLCAVGTLSVLHIRGYGVDRVGSPSSITGGVGGRLQLLWPALQRFGVVVQGEALVNLAPRDVLLNQTTVWSTAPLAFTAILDFAAIFR